MKKIFNISLIILSFFYFFLAWSLIENLLIRDAQLKFLNSTSSDYVCSYYGDSDFDNDFYYMNKTLSLEHNNKKIFAELLMYKVDKSYTISPFKNYQSIKKDEIVISKNVADLYNLKKGDALTLSSALNGDLLKYYVKDVIRPIYCFTEEFFVEDRGIIILGCSPEFVESNNLSLAFISDAEGLNMINLKKITSIELSKRSINKDTFFDSIVILGISCFIFLVYLFLFEIVFSSRIRKQIIFGASVKTIFCSYYIKPIIWSIMHVLITLLFVLLESFITLRMFIFPIALLMLLIVPFISCIVSLVVMKIRIRRV